MESDAIRDLIRAKKKLLRLEAQLRALGIDGSRKSKRALDSERKFLSALPDSPNRWNDAQLREWKERFQP